MKGVKASKAPPPVLAASGALNMARFAETSPPAAAAPLDMGQYEDADLAAMEAQPQPEEPSLIEAGLRGLKQGVTFGFGDELTGALESAFTSKTYKQARDEARAADKAAQEAHPWGYGLSQALGGVATGVATGGLAGAAAKLGTAGVAGLAAGEGALGAVGESEADSAGGLAKDALVGGAVGGVLGGTLHKVLGGYADTAIERRARHLTEDVADGAIPVVKRRLGKVTMPDEAGNSLAVNTLDSDPEFLKALGSGKKEAIEVTQKRLDELGKTVKPAYQQIDDATGGIRFGDVRKALDEAIAKADQPGNSNIRDALQGTLKDIEGVVARRESKLAKGGKAVPKEQEPIHRALFGPEGKANDGEIVRKVKPDVLSDVRDIEGKPIAATSETRMQSIRDLFDRKVGRNGDRRAVDELRQPVVAVSPEGRMEIVDGRHRLLVARERGEEFPVKFVEGSPSMDKRAGADWPAPKASSDNATAPATRTVDDHMLPSQDVRAWVSRLLKRADQSMGSLSETERKVVKDKVHEAAHDFLRSSLQGTAEARPELAGAVKSILDANKQIRVYASVKEALTKAAERKNWSPSSLKDMLANASLPGVGALIAGGADIATGGLTYAGIKGAQALGGKLNRAATFQLAKLVRAAKAGGASQAMALDAIKAGVPAGVVKGIVGPAFSVGDNAEEATQ